jgi:hypothetical protein
VWSPDTRADTARRVCAEMASVPVSGFENIFTPPLKKNGFSVKTEKIQREKNSFLVSFFVSRHA